MVMAIPALLSAAPGLPTIFSGFEIIVDGGCSSVVELLIACPGMPFELWIIQFIF